MIWVGVCTPTYFGAFSELDKHIPEKGVLPQEIAFRGFDGDLDVSLASDSMRRMHRDLLSLTAMH